ncbi:SH3 domain-containing protein [Devosia sp. LjRoot3]|uniref:SH3 domain-containing protein n=1 Tax=Devosia sp. LjRoot3 TaxID=3342319 RepID=UPI003ED03558
MFPIFRRFLSMATLALFLGSAQLAAAQDARTVEIRFPRGQSGTTVSQSISGYQSFNYVLGVSAGQRMNVQLDTDNPSNYFNITAPGASEALFNGSISGTSTSFDIPSSGNYTISVYLMRNAARRGETADYDLTIYVEGRPTAAAPASVQNDFADGLAGGPDFWQVHGLSGGDTLNVRSAPSTGSSVLGRLVEGDIVRNLGCQMNGSTRWCSIESNRGLSGWVAGRYLHESMNQAPQRPAPQRPTTLPAPVPSVLPAPLPVVPVDSVSTANMPRFCVGEASAQFGVRPQDITANMAFQTGNMYVSQGYFDRDGDTTFFNCYFQLNGSFIAVN